MNTIDYGMLARASALYEAQGFKPIEVPWRITEDILNITKPSHVQNKDYMIQGTDKGLIASGEQGFLYLANKGVLPPGKYQTITPCYRNETHDRYHSKQFMKLELIELLDPCSAIELTNARLMQDAVESMARTAKSVMSNLMNEDLLKYLLIVNTGNFDEIAVPGTQQRDVTIMLDREIELGSYGARRTSFATWIYGTGLAEPRFSKAVNEGLQHL